MRIATLLVPLLILTSCGGGGGGGSDFAGNYLFQLRLVVDECGESFGPSRDIAFHVDQDEDNIMVTNLFSGAMLSGFTTGEGWLTARSGSFGSCTESIQVGYDGESGGVFRLARECPDGSQCETVYDASVQRE